MAIEMLTDKSVYLRRDSNDKPIYRAEIIADTAAELAGVTEQGSVVFGFGSVALTADGKALLLGSGGVWHDLSDGAEIEVSGT